MGLATAATRPMNKANWSHPGNGIAISLSELIRLQNAQQQIADEQEPDDDPHDGGHGQSLSQARA
jgi:hypothetical protein